jgi:hypothetical protein
MEFDDDDNVTELWFDESYCSAELDEKLLELYGKGVVGGGTFMVNRGDYLMAAAGRSKYRKVLQRFLKDKLAIR